MNKCTWKDADPDNAACNNCGLGFESTEEFESHFEQSLYTPAEAAAIRRADHEEGR